MSVDEEERAQHLLLQWSPSAVAARIASPLGSSYSSDPKEPIVARGSDRFWTLASNLQIISEDQIGGAATEQECQRDGDGEPADRGRGA